MDNENSFMDLNIVSSTSAESVGNTNEDQTNEGIVNYCIRNENITEEDNKLQPSIENVPTSNSTAPDDLLDVSNPGSSTTSNVENEKPIETYKKVKLKRSHILKKLSTSININVSTNSPTDTENNKTSEMTIENVTSNPLNIDIPDDSISTSLDFDLNDASSNSDSTCSPTPRKKVKLIRNNPRFKSNITVKPHTVVVKDDEVTTSSSSPKIINTDFTISQATISDIEENITLNDPKINDIDVKSAYKMDGESDISDVVAQIDQIIGPDDGSIIPSSNFLDSDDLSLSDGLKNDDLCLMEDLDKEIETIPVINESSNDVIEKIVDDLDEICTKQNENLVETTFEEKLETDLHNESLENVDQPPMVDENFSLILDESSDGPKEESDLSLEIGKHSDINDYNIDLDDKVETVDDLEKKLLDVSAQVDALDCSSMEVDELLGPIPIENQIEDFNDMNSDIHNSILSDNIESVEDSTENKYDFALDNSADVFVETRIESEIIPANVDNSTEVSSSSSIQNIIDNGLPSSSTITDLPKITLTIKKSTETNSAEILPTINSTNVEEDDTKRVPKITIKSIKKPTSETDNSTILTIKTVPQSDSSESHVDSTEDAVIESRSANLSNLEAIPKLTIRNIKKAQDEEVTEKVVIPKLTIKPLRKPTDNLQQNNQMLIVTSEVQQNTIDVIPKLTIKTKKGLENEDTISESTSSVEYIPKLTIKSGKKIENIETSIDSSTVEESLPKITIKNTSDKSFEIIPNTSLCLSEESSTDDESIDFTDNISAANKSSLAAANMELIPRLSMKDNARTQTDSDDEEIEVIPSILDKSTTECIPKLSIKALKKSLQTDHRDLESHLQETNFKSIPSGTNSKLIIKPVLNMNQNLSRKPDSSATQSLLKTVDKITVGKIQDDLPETSKLQRKMLMNISGKNSFEEDENSGKTDRIVLKINKDNESMRSHLMTENALRVDTGSPLEKITLKLSKEGGHPEILSPSSFSNNASLKRMLSPETTIEPVHVEQKKLKTNETSIEFSSGDISINIIKPNASSSKKLQSISDDVTIVRMSSDNPQPIKAEPSSNSSKLKDILMKFNVNRIEPQDDVDSSSSDDVKIVEIIQPPKVSAPDPLSISNDESSSQDVMIVDDIIPIEELKPNLPPIPKKRGRPRKIPLEVRPELKEELSEPMITVNELIPDDIPSPAQQVSDDDENFEFSLKRGYNIRGARRGVYRSRRGRGGRGSRGGRGAYKRRAEEKRRALLDLKAAITSDVTVALDKLDVEKRNLLRLKADGSVEAFFMEEDTRMSADGELGETGTHIKPEITDESRSSSTTTENNRNKRGRLEISEIDVHVTGPDQIAEYNWGNGGPFMLQEQVAQYLGVKSFKRKYPGLTRHAVDMQERDYIRENGLASEALCDMGLTSVLSSEILDIMFTDFQDKYEEYRKYQREKQAKDVTNKQRAMATSMATNADKGGKEESVLQKAIRSAASWNASLNKNRKEERRCYLDLQSFAVMYPRGRKPITQNTNPGDYPVALVPGQFSEFYKEYSSTDLKYLPVNSVLYGPIVQNLSIPEIGYSDGSCSESESSSGSDSDSSDDSDSTTMDGITTPLTNPPTLNTESDTCKICITSSPKSRPVKSSLIYCAQCNAGIHPRCIDLTVDMMPFIQAYPWQCTDCKTCWQCRRPSDDDKMLFCDRCDRGYHIYCVGLRKVPNGRWHCQQCIVTTSTNTGMTHSVSVGT